MDLWSPIANSSIQLWLDFSGTLPAVIPPCQQRDIDYELMNNPNVTFQNCTDICNNISALIDPLLLNNLLVCGLWASSVGFEKFVGPNIDEDPVLSMSIGLDGKNLSYVDDVQRSISGVFQWMYVFATAGTSDIDFTIPESCTVDKLFPKRFLVSRYAAPCLRSI